MIESKAPALVFLFSQALTETPSTIMTHIHKHKVSSKSRHA
ncbi:unnamed protein product [Amoebophrya sp. A120]|nr:unnamed protein product [Amoebophrya sp. A120]|eukprot:GSA120T00015311001.1